MEPGDEARCEHCIVGFHPPFERFERLAVRPDGPTFLMRCVFCDTLWDETVRGARKITPEDARPIYPDAPL